MSKVRNYLLDYYLLTTILSHSILIDYQSLETKLRSMMLRIVMINYHDEHFFHGT